jgi:hypothetical protein
LKFQIPDCFVSPDRTTIVARREKKRKVQTGVNVIWDGTPFDAPVVPTTWNVYTSQATTSNQSVIGFQVSGSRFQVSGEQ